MKLLFIMLAFSFLGGCCGYCVGYMRGAAAPKGDSNG